jgi:hypothetical protein
MRFQEINLLESIKFSLFEYKDAKEAANALYSVLAHYYRSQISAASGDPSANNFMISKIKNKVASEFGDYLVKQVEARFPFASWDAAKAAFTTAWNDTSKTEADISTLKSKILDQFGAEGPKSFFALLPLRNAKPTTAKNTEKEKTSNAGSFEHNYMGWTFRIYRFVDPKAGKLGSNKVWGFATKDGRAMIFWGKYRGATQFKPVDLAWAHHVAQTKVAKGYKQEKIDPTIYSYIFSQARNF